MTKLKIFVERFAERQIEDKGIPSWPIWQCGVSKFGWLYEESEECLILQGHATIYYGDEQLDLRTGDFVTFPAGLECTWDVKEPIRKHYNFP